MLYWGPIQEPCIMKSTIAHALLFLSALLFVAGCQSMRGSSAVQTRYVAVYPTASDETELLWNQLRMVDFYRVNGYQPAWPAGDAMDRLRERAARGDLATADHEVLRQFVEQKAYDKDDYSKGYNQILTVIDKANSVIPTFLRLREKWRFYVPSQYNIYLTLYGPGGSYDARKGAIYLKTTKEGRFARGLSPLDTILHESFHIGIENSIVKKYGLSQWTKERLVDLFMINSFGGLCPHYTVQPNRETAIDRIVDYPDVWDNLPKAVEEFLKASE